MSIKLTEFSSGSGCGCKIHPEKLEEILIGKKTNQFFPNLLIGNDKADDASIFQLDAEKALIQTCDFFTPIVNDAYNFGRISAANALSDIYAMGGKPLMANAILCWPIEKLSTELASKVIEGALSICEEAEIPLAGGHSININEPVFGLSVTGIIHPKNIKSNSGAQASDFLFITKPLGTGMTATAIKRNLADENTENQLILIASQLNKIGEKLGELKGVNAITDITGFGLYGHLLELCRGADLSSELYFEKIPLLEFAKPWAEQFILPDNSFRNWNSYKNYIDCKNDSAFAWLNDPQTNGGLLISVAESEIENYVKLSKQYNLPDFSRIPIGKMIKKTEKFIKVL